MGLNFSRDEDYDELEDDGDMTIPMLNEIPFLARDDPVLKRGFSAADLETVREWECLLVFQIGDPDKILTEADCEGIRDSLEYHDIVKEKKRRRDDDDKEAEEDTRGVVEGMTEFDFYKEEKRKVLEVLRKLELRVLKCKALEFQEDADDDEEKKDLEFFYVGVSEERARAWAAETGYELELNPQKAIDYLFMMDEPLATATRSEDSLAIRVRDSHWKHCYVKFFAGVPPQIYYQYPIRSPDDSKKYESSMFRTRDRLAIILEIVQSDIEEGGAGIYVASLKIKEHPIAEMFPIHNATRLDRIMAELFTRKLSHFQNFPLEDIRDYFGEYIALYFAFLQFQTQYFAPAAIAGVVFYAYSASLGGVLAPGIGYVALAATIWAMLFPVFWVRREYFWAMHWGQARFDQAERNRPEYEGNYQKSRIHGKKEEFFPPGERFSRQMCSFNIFAGFLVSLLASVVGVMLLRVIILTSKPPVAGGPIIIGVANSMVIIIFNNVYGMVAEWLNSWENYRTDTQYENSLILKVFVFRFVNSFTALYYMAFFLRYQPHKGSAAIGCKPAICMSLLGTQVMIIFVTQLTVNNVIEIGSIVGGRLVSTSASFSDPDPSVSLWVQWKSEEYVSTFEDFNELLIQFGYASLFFVSFPLAPMLAWLSLALEARVDGYKLCRATRRPFPRGADDIGAWQFAQEFMGWATLFTNLGLIILITQDIIFPFNVHILIFKEVLTGVILFVFIYVTFRILKDIYGAKPTLIARHIARQEHIERELENASELVKTFLNRLAASKDGRDLKRWRTWNVHQVLKFINETMCLNEKLFFEISNVFSEAQIGGERFEQLTVEELLEAGIENENYAVFLVSSRDQLIEAEIIAQQQADTIDNAEDAVTQRTGHGEAMSLDDLLPMADFFQDDLVGLAKRRLWNKVDANRSNRIEEDELAKFLYFAIIVYMKAKDASARLPKQDDASVQAVLLPLTDWLIRNKVESHGLTYEEFETEFPEWLRQYVRQQEHGLAGGSTIRGDPLYDPVGAEWDGRLADVVATMSNKSNLLDGLWKKLDKSKRGRLNVDKYMPRLVFGLIALYCRVKKNEGLVAPAFPDLADWASLITRLIKSQLGNPETISEDDFKENFLRYLSHVADERAGVHRAADAADDEDAAGKKRGLWPFGRKG